MAKLTLGERLKKLRENENLTMEQLSEIFNKKYIPGTYKSKISLWENNKQKPNIDSLEMYADYFNISIDFLLKGIANKQRTTEDIEAITINNLNELQKQKLDNFVKSNTLMFFSGNKELTEEQKESIDKSLSKVFIEILRNKGEIK